MDTKEKQKKYEKGSVEAKQRMEHIRSFRKAKTSPPTSTPQTTPIIYASDKCDVENKKTFRKHLNNIVSF